MVSDDAPDDVYEFHADGSSRSFGRDPAVCDIVIGSVLDAPLLSRVAGRVWRMQGELWLRNLSVTHELYVDGAEGPPEPPLPPRRDAADPGPARSIPAPVAWITGPARCRLRVSQFARERYQPPLAPMGEATLNLPPLPASLRLVAAALCEPLLRGGQLPASYREVARRAGVGSVKQARSLVGALCTLYTAELPALGDRSHRAGPRCDGRHAEPLRRRLVGGVWVFDPVECAACDGCGTGSAEEEVAARRRHSLNLPDYYEVAHLLVRRRLVSWADVEDLGAEG